MISIFHTFNSQTDIDMKKTFLLLITLFGINFSFGQIQSTIINAETNEPIPYANIWLKEGNGTNSNKKGEFILDKVSDTSTVFFSAIGYHTKNLLVRQITKVIKLTPAIFQLHEVEIKNRRFDKQLIVGELKKSEIKSSQENLTGRAYKIGRYFEYQELFKETPYLQKIKVATKSRIKNATFNIKFYAVNTEKNQAKDLIFHKNIIVSVKRGKRITEIDLSSYNLPFPKNGLLVSLEWLAIESNIGSPMKIKMMDGKKRTFPRLEPRFRTIERKTNEIGWNPYNTVWQKNNFNNLFYIERSKYKPAIELTLNN